MLYNISCLSLGSKGADWEYMGIWKSAQALAIDAIARCQDLL